MKLLFYRLSKFDQPLESSEDFDKFSDLLQIFELKRGKALDNDGGEDDEKRKAGFFKGSFRIYRLPIFGGWIKCHRFVREFNFFLVFFVKDFYFLEKDPKTKNQIEHSKMS